jgi:hypothetical protein
LPALTKALSDYTFDTQLLLRDFTFATYTQPSVTSAINHGIQQRDLDLGINRVKYSFPMVTGQFTYSFSAIQGGTLLFGNAAQALIDVLSIIVVPLGSQTAGIRYPMGRWPYSRLAYLLSTSYPTYPVKYAIYGTNTIIVAPPPANPYPTEWDFFTAAPPLVNQTDVDPIPYPWTDPVPFWAAHLLKLGNQRFDEAGEFKKEYNWHLARVMARGRPIAVQNPWADLPRGAR